MQGRLTPPTDERIQFFPIGQWRSEFRLAAEAGLDSVEWLYEERAQEQNPIATDDGIESILHECASHGLSVVSLCAHYFCERPLVRAGSSHSDDGLARLRWLIGRSRLLGVQWIVLPLLEQSDIRSAAEIREAVTALLKVAEFAASSRVRLHLETSLPPAQLSEMMDLLPPEAFMVNYDIGNSASLAFNPRDEFEAYGSRIGSVHIKDRIRGGGSVPLGSGCADFEAVFGELRKLSYEGDFVLEAARGRSGDELAWASGNCTLARTWARSLELPNSSGGFA